MMNAHESANFLRTLEDSYEFPVSYTVITSYSIHYTKLYEMFGITSPAVVDVVPDFDYLPFAYGDGGVHYINGVL